MVLTVKNFSDEIHHDTKVQVAIEGIPMKELIERALREYLKKKGMSSYPL